MLEAAQQRDALRDLQQGGPRHALPAEQLTHAERQVGGLVRALEAHVVANLGERVERGRRGRIVAQAELAQARLHVGDAAVRQHAQGVIGSETDGAVGRAEVGSQLVERARALVQQLACLGHRRAGRRRHDGGFRAERVRVGRHVQSGLRRLRLLRRALARVQREQREQHRGHPHDVLEG